MKANGNQTFQGYRRNNGRVGVRNHVIILPVDDLSNAASVAVANNIKGAMAIPHPYGRLQFGADLELHFRTLIGTGSNPNVAAVVVIGIEDQWTQKIVDGIAATGKPVTGFGIEQHGDHETIMRASKAAREYAVGERARARGMLDRYVVGVDEVRGIRHDLRLRRQPHRRQCIRQALSARHDARVRRNHRADRRRASVAERCRTPRCARSSCNTLTGTSKSLIDIRQVISPIRSQQRATFSAA